MDKIIYTLEQIYNMTHIPVRYLNRTGEITIFRRGYGQKSDPIFCDEDLCSRIIKKSEHNTLPVLEFEEEIIYGALNDTVKGNIIFGPVCVAKIDEEHTKRYMRQHKISDKNFHLKHETMGGLNAALAMLYFVVRGNYVTELEIVTEGKGNPDNKSISDNKFDKYLMEISEQIAPRHNFHDEIDAMKDIKEGSPDRIRLKFINATPDDLLEDSVGKLAKSFFKQHEYLVCTVIALSSRAAIDGGLDSMTAYLMSDIFLQQLEACKDIPSFYRVMQSVMIDYAEKVKQKKEEHKGFSYAEMCKSYITRHLNKRFTIDDVADEIGINKSYLSRQFSTAEGVGIQHYALIKRIEAAAHMLKYSDEPLSSISEYLCFSSQSHFGKVFKKQIGMTPLNYRNKNKIIDFVL